MSKGSSDRVRKLEQFKKNNSTIYDHARQLRAPRPGKTTYVRGEGGKLVPKKETELKFVIGIDFALGPDYITVCSLDHIKIEQRVRDGVFELASIPKKLLGL